MFPKLPKSRHELHECLNAFEAKICKELFLLANDTSVVPRARHCGIPAILPPMSLRNAPSAGPKGAPRKSAYYFSLFSTISVFSVT